MNNYDSITIGCRKKESQVDGFRSSANLRQQPHNQTKRENPPLAYYEQLMRHDWHAKVHHRVRQRGWGR